MRTDFELIFPPRVLWSVGAVVVCAALVFAPVSAVENFAGAAASAGEWLTQNDFSSQILGVTALFFSAVMVILLFILHSRETADA